MRKRLFIGVPMSSEFQKAFAAYGKKLHEMRLLNVQKLRWADTKNLHLTLCFLGSFDEIYIPVIVETLHSIAVNFTPFSLRFSGAAWGPPGRPARMVWGMFALHAMYTRLAHDIAQSLERKLSEHVERIIRLIEDGEIIPHVTLARFSDIPKSGQRTLPLLDGAPNQMMVRSFSLYESTLMSTGASYKPLHSFTLKK
jgi:2'-5' RNA ligase